MPISEWMQALRAIIGCDLIVTVGASAVVFNDQGEILLQQRADNGQWGIPGGGIEPGEEPAKAAVREVYEETGYHVDAVRLLGVFGGERQIRAYPNGDRFAYVSITFECRLIGGSINPDPDETIAVGWFAPDALPAGLSDVHRHRIQKFKDHLVPYYEMPATGTPSPAPSDYLRDIRPHIGNLLLMMPACNTVVFNDEGAILVQQRRDNGEWNLPGGVYEIGEEPAETAIRETYEETGLIVRPTRIVGVYGGQQFMYTYPSGDQFAFIDIVFACEIVGGELVSNSNEATAHRFVMPDELPEPFMDKHRQLIQHAIQHDTPYFVS